jgi:hypothetical protein
MDVAAVIVDALKGWIRRPGPAPPGAVAELESGAPVRLPAEYLDLLRLHDGGEGELGGGPGWFEIWPTTVVLAANRECRDAGLPQGFFGFGSSGAGELLALDCRGEPPYPVVMMPFIPLDSAVAQPVAADFGAFVRLLGRACPDA